MSDAAAGILRAETRLARTAEWARGIVARQPASVGIAAVLVATTVIIDLAVLAGSPLRHGHGRAGARATPSLLLAHQPIELLLGIVATLLLLGFAERRIGTRRALVAYVATAAVSFGAAALIRFAVMDVFGSGAPAGYRAATIPLSAPAVGALMAASAFTGPLWRRRIRVLGFAAAATFVLFEGSFSGVVTLVAALAGFAVGIALRSGSGRRQTRLTWARSSHHEARVLLSSLVTISAVGPLLAALSPTPVGPLAPLGALFRDTLPTTSLSMACRVTSQAVGTDFVLNPYGECTRALALDGLHTPGTVALGFLPLVALFVTAFFIRRGRRLAVVVAIAVNALLGAVSASTFLATPVPAGGPGARFGALHALLSGISALVPWAIAVVLVLLLPHFTVRAEARTVRRLLVAVAATAVGLGAAYVLAGSLESDVFVPSVSGAGLVVSAVERLVPVGFIGLDRLGPVPTGGVSRVLFENIGWIFWTVVVVATGLACTHRGTAPGSRQRRAALDRILRRGVAGNLAFMSTWEGMSLWFTADERAAVAYRQVGTIVLTTGDPLCSDEDAPEVVAGFARWCDDQGLVPVFYSVRSALRPLFRSLSWYDLPVGEETVLRPRTFSLQGKKWQDVRSSMNRAAKEGVRAEWTTHASLAPHLARQIQDISEQWVADKGLPEMGFTLGGLEELTDREVALMLALDEQDRVLAVTSWLPSYRDGAVVGWTLDFMRRRPDSMNGVMEFVIASTALRAQEDDLEFLSLSAAPLASSEAPDPESRAAATDRVLGFLGRTLEPAYGFRSLLAFKKKFQPEYEQLIMAYADPLDLPRIGAALGRAYLPDVRAGQIPRLLRTMR